MHDVPCEVNKLLLYTDSIAGSHSDSILHSIIVILSTKYPHLLSACSVLATQEVAEDVRGAGLFWYTRSAQL